jgi:hypothetical protein
MLSTSNSAPQRTHVNIFSLSHSAVEESRPDTSNDIFISANVNTPAALLPADAKRHVFLGRHFHVECCLCIECVPYNLPSELSRTSANCRIVTLMIKIETQEMMQTCCATLYV